MGPGSDTRPRPLPSSSPRGAGSVHLSDAVSAFVGRPPVGHRFLESGTWAKAQR